MPKRSAQAGQPPVMPDCQAIVFVKGEVTAPQVRRVLEPLGYTLRVFEAGEAVLACLDAAPRDLLLIDDDAHPLGAFAFLQLARPLLREGKTPAIILTRSGGTPEQGGDAAEVFLEQPFGDDDLRDAVETARWVRMSSMTTQLGMPAAIPKRSGTGLPAATLEDDDEPTVRDIAPPVRTTGGRPSSGWSSAQVGKIDPDRPTVAEGAPGGRKRFKSTLAFSGKQVSTVSTSVAMAQPATAPSAPAVEPPDDPEATVFHGPNSKEARELREALRTGRPGTTTSPPAAPSPPVAASATPGRRGPRHDSAMSGLLRAADVGDVIADRYELLGVLGSGGMAVVYRAHDRELDEAVALKLLKADKDDEESLTRFRHELRICRRLQHHAIVQTFEFGVWEGRRFLTMELLDGVDLNALLQQRGQKLEVLEAVELVIQAAEGLHAAHRAGVIHRDIKPHNLFVMADGRRLKIMDFGIAKSEEMSHTMTSAAHVLGTPAYLAPERLRDHVELSAQTDLYSLGVVLYQALTGKLPFSGPDISTLLTSILVDTPKAARKIRPDVPTALDDVVMRTLAREPDARQPSCGVLAEELAEIARNLRRAWA